MKNVKEKISVLWIVVMFNMILADILTFITPGEMAKIVSENTDVTITKSLLLVFALLLEIPIIMIFLSRILPPLLNRIFNISGAIITIIFIIGGGSLFPHYIFFASVETICMIAIIVISLKWKQIESV